MSYEVGSLVTLRVEARDDLGVPTDTTMGIDVTAPDGTVTSPAVTSDGGTGKYKTTVLASMAEDWAYTWLGTGVLQVVQSGQFNVRRPGPMIVSLEEVKKHLNKSLTKHEDDDELRGFIDAAQVVIEDITGPVVPIEYTELYSGLGFAGGKYLILRNRPVASIVSITEDVGGTPISLVEEAGLGTTNDFLLMKGEGFVLRRYNGRTGIWAKGDDNIRVVYRAGRYPLPANVKLAARELTGHLWRNTQLARGSIRAAAGADDILAATQGYSLPNRVVELLAPFHKEPQQGS